VAIQIKVRQREQLMKWVPDLEALKLYGDAKAKAVSDNLKKLNLSRSIVLTAESFEYLPSVFRKDAVDELARNQRAFGANFGLATSLSVHIMWKHIFSEAFGRQNSDQRIDTEKFRYRCSKGLIKKIIDDSGWALSFDTGLDCAEKVAFADIIFDDPNTEEFPQLALYSGITLYFFSKSSELLGDGKSDEGFLYLREATMVESWHAYGEGYDAALDSFDQFSDGDNPPSLSENGRRAAQARHRLTNDQKDNVLKLWRELKLSGMSKNAAAKKISSADGMTVREATIRAWLQGKHL
jgi:hypothetical protein